MDDLEYRADRCTTHHHACDCREYAQQKRIAELEAENEWLREVIAECADDFDCAAEGNGINFYQCALDLRAALAKGLEE